MRINAKGLHWTTVTLADGSKKTYWYAWRGGPRLTGEYRSPEFIASYNAAIATKVAAPEGRLLALTQAFQQSQDFLALRERTRADYIKQIAKIEQRFGDAPIKALADPRTRGIFLDWRDQLALKSKRQADYAWTVLARVLSWAKDRGRISVNPCTFNDLRGIAVTRLALVGCTEAEIATITGHSLRDVRSILDAHYLHRDIELARTAINKLEMGYAKLAEAKTGTEFSK